MTKIKTGSPDEFNRCRETSFGQVCFDGNGISGDIDKEAAEALTSVSPSLSIVAESGEQGTGEPEPEKPAQTPEKQEEVIQPTQPVAPATPEVPVTETPAAPATEPTQVEQVEQPVVADIEPKQAEGTGEPMTGTEVPADGAQHTLTEETKTEDVIQQTTAPAPAPEPAAPVTDQKAEIKAALETKSMADLRDYCENILKLPAVEYEQFKGKDAKDAFIDFIISKLQ